MRGSSLSANGDTFIGSPRIDVLPLSNDDWQCLKQKVSSIVLIVRIAWTERRTPSPADEKVDEIAINTDARSVSNHLPRLAHNRGLPTVRARFVR